MRIQARSFWLPKAGNAADEYEDAYCPRRQPAARGAQISRFAVADGATETSFSALWASMLVQGWCRGGLEQAAMAQTLARLRKTWDERVRGKPLPWYAEEKARAGAYAALLGLTLSEGAGGTASARWQAMAVGDTCLFVLRNGRLATAFPLCRVRDFNSRPHLLSSNDHADEHASPLFASGRCLSGDRFYLMTDALACWFLGQMERKHRPWEQLDRFDRPRAAAGFRHWIALLREGRSIRNDDVTLLRVDVE